MLGIDLGTKRYISEEEERQTKVKTAKDVK